jgi:hypothetical protein
MFLIRNKKTEEWLSILDDDGRVRRRGHTHAKLSKTEPPRLFISKQGAKFALRAWLSGRITVHRNYGGPWEEQENEDWRTEKDETRIAEDMEIRECEIVLK